MNIITKNYRLNIFINDMVGVYETYFRVYDRTIQSCVNLPQCINKDLFNSFFNHITERCLKENGLSMCELNYMENHFTNSKLISLYELELILTIDVKSKKWIAFKILDPKRHNNIGFEHLYDDSEYPNDF